MDICVNNAYPLHNTELLRRFALWDIRVRYLALVVKTWAKAKGVSNPHNATISSYTWVLLVIYFMQHYAKEHSWNIPEHVVYDGVYRKQSIAEIFEPLYQQTVLSPNESSGIGIPIKDITVLLLKFYAFYATDSTLGCYASRNVIKLHANLKCAVDDIPMKSCVAHLCKNAPPKKKLTVKKTSKNVCYEFASSSMY